MHVFRHDHVSPDGNMEQSPGIFECGDNPAATPITSQEGKSAVAGISHEMRVRRVVPGHPRLSNRQIHRFKRIPLLKSSGTQAHPESTEQCHPARFNHERCQMDRIVLKCYLVVLVVAM